MIRLLNLPLYSFPVAFLCPALAKTKLLSRTNLSLQSNFGVQFGSWCLFFYHLFWNQRQQATLSCPFTCLAIFCIFLLWTCIFCSEGNKRVASFFLCAVDFRTFALKVTTVEMPAFLSTFHTICNSWSKVQICWCWGSNNSSALHSIGCLSSHETINSFIVNT